MRATPKSVSLATPAPSCGRSGTITLPGLTSRWTTPRPCAWASASHSATPTRSTSRSDSSPSRMQLGQRAPAHELGDQVDGLVVAPGLVEGDDPRVRQARRGARLALGARRHRGVVHRDALDRDGALEVLVLGQPHDAEAARADLAHEPVAAEHAPRVAAGARGRARRWRPWARRRSSPPPWLRRPAACLLAVHVPRAVPRKVRLRWAYWPFPQARPGAVACRSSTRVTSPHECDRAPRGRAVRPPPRAAVAREPHRTARPPACARRSASARSSILAILIVLGFKGCLRQPQGQRAEGLQPQRHGGHQRLRPVGRASRSSSACPTARATRRACRCRSTSCAWPPRTTSSAPKAFDVPGDMGAAQRNLELVLNLRAEGLTKIADQIPAALGRGQTSEQRDQQDRRRDAGLPGLRRRLLPARRAADQGRPRQERRQRPADRRRAASCRTSRGWRRPPSPRAWAAARAAARAGTSRPAGAGPARPRARSSTSVGAVTLQPEAPGVVNRVPWSSNPTLHRQVRQPGRQRRVQRQGLGLGQADGAASRSRSTKTIGQTKAKQTATVNIPLGAAPPAGTPTTVDRRDRQGPRREERPTTTARATRSSSRAEPARRRARGSTAGAYPWRRGRPLLDNGDRRAGRRRPGARRARSPCVVLVRALRRLRADQRAILGGSSPQDLVAHAAELDRGFGSLTTTSSDVGRPASTRGSARPRGASTAPIAYRGLVRYDAYNEMSGRQSTSIALLDAARLGHRASPPSTTATRRACTPSRCVAGRARARALARGGGGDARGAGRRGARRGRAPRRRSS